MSAAPARRVLSAAALGPLARRACRPRPCPSAVPSAPPPRARALPAALEELTAALRPVEDVLQGVPLGRLQGRLPACLEAEVLQWARGLRGGGAVGGAARPLHRLALGHAVARSGALADCFRPQLLQVPGGGTALRTADPLLRFNRLAERHRALCDLRVLAPLYGLAPRPQLWHTVQHVLRRALAEQRAPLPTAPAPAPPPPPLVPLYDGGAPGPALYHFTPARCDWALLHLFEGRPTATVVALAAENRWHRDAQRPTEAEEQVLRTAVRSRYGLPNGAAVALQLVPLPPTNVDRPAFLQLRRALGRLPRAVEGVWELFDAPAVADEDLEAWRTGTPPPDWLLPPGHRPD